MRETDRLADLVERVMTGDPWHGSNVETLLRGVSAADAARRPLSGGHSIWELVLHMTGWAREAQARLQGAAAGTPAAGDWPAVTEPTTARWRRDRQALFASHVDLAAAVRAASPDILDRAVVDRRNRATGTGLSKYLTLHGVVHHTVYHAGQIAQLRRALG